MSAEKAMEKLNGREVCGRNIRIDTANSTPGGGNRGGNSGGRGTRGSRGGGRGRGGGGRGGGERTPSKTLMAFNLSFDTEPYSLQEVFENANDVYLPKNKETGEKRGYDVT